MIDLLLAAIDAAHSRNRRAELTEKRVCINGETHGHVESGVRCPWCKAVHRHGLAAVLADPNAPARPPGYMPRLREISRRESQHEQG